jgi:hypothetical protein
MRRELIKIAIGLDYFLRKDMTPADAAKLNALLDQQGIPKHPQSVDVKAKFHYADTPQPVGGTQRFMDHLRRNKGRYGLGAAGLAGAALLLHRNRLPEMPDPSLTEQQAGF